MWPYWIMFMLPAAASLHNRWAIDSSIMSRRSQQRGAWFWAVALLTLLIGYRIEVGGDWWNYLRNFENMTDRSLVEALAMGDPGYRLLEWISHEAGWGILGVNLIGAILFSVGLAVFCRSLPRPWLALAIAVPYMVIVIAMGYTRQGIAIGLAMIGLVLLGHQSVRGFVFWVLFAAVFHKSAVLLLPIAALAATRRKIWTAVWISIVVVGAYLAMLEKSVDDLYTNYVLAGYQSQGALIRLVMNAMPAAILLIWRQRFQMTLSQMRLWVWCSIISLGLLGLYFASPSSTAIDRVALLMLPVQLAVFSHVPEVFGAKRSSNILFVLAVLLYYALVQFVWLNYATHAYAWLPYQNWLFI
ncbi:EpsG family protein [Desulfuromonas sp. TF]|uniref:EpsG family protein n=1 Tax=Desulfuromonas sp. TF TaxID=1232410 RepID=UPI000404B1F4|nr:EpsG family protein [Desulfuromonas sp. TF]